MNYNVNKIKEQHDLLKHMDPRFPYGDAESDQSVRNWFMFSWLRKEGIELVECALIVIERSWW